MPSLTRWLNALNLTDQNSSSGASSAKLDIPIEESRPGTTTSYFLAPFIPSTDPAAPLLLPIPPPNRSQVQPPGSLHFGFTHPSPSSDSPTTFFLTCIPDPIGFLAQSASFIRAHLGTGSSGPSKWRHEQIHLILEDEPGLAYTSAGMMHVSLQWVGDIMRQVRSGGRELSSATHEFKGVLLHELVHAVQYDGHGSTPTWLTESIADFVRLQAHLGPPHWRHPGQGKQDRGWEDGYDAGAQFLSWLVGATGVDDRPGQQSEEPTPTPPRTAPTSSGAPSPQFTQYPADPRPPGPAPEPNHGKTRPGPWPDLVSRLNASLEHERYADQCWDGLTGQRGGLEALWKAYLEHYL